MKKYESGETGGELCRTDKAELRAASGYVMKAGEEV